METQVQVNSGEEVRQVFTPMLFEEIAMTDMSKIVADHAYVLEQKLDGMRLMTVITAGKVEFLGALGGRLASTAAMQHYSALADSLGKLIGRPGERLVLDGEIMCETGVYHVFDLVDATLAGTHFIAPNMAFGFRRAALVAAVEPILKTEMITNVVVIRQARTTDEKKALVAGVTAIGGEGFMAKAINAPYDMGRRVKHSVKLKFVRTADVIAVAVERGFNENTKRETGTAKLSVYGPDGTLVPVGNCSLAYKPQVAVGDVIEVAYLAFRGAMVQPRMTRTRPDKPAEQCTIAQFPAYSKEVV